MEIQRLNQQRIDWQKLTAKEILKYQDEGKDVPSEYQKWAAAITAVLDTQDDITYQMVNGETDIGALEEVLGKERVTGEVEIAPADETENNIGQENENPPEEQPIIKPEEPEVPQDDVTLADPSITTDPNEILKRKLRRGQIS